MQASVEEIRGRIKALDSQMEFEAEAQAGYQKGLEKSRERFDELAELRQGYLRILTVVGEGAEDAARRAAEQVAWERSSGSTP